MNSQLLNAVVLLAAGGVVFGISLLIRRWVDAHPKPDPAPWLATLSYVATAYAVVVGFSIVFLFGEFSAARSAVGDEATSLGTAFHEASLFPDSADEIQGALICYGRAVPEFGWPALREGRAAPEVDRAYSDLVTSLGVDDAPAVGALHAATATNLVLHVGNIAKSRETRLVSAQTKVPTMLWVLLVGGGLLVLGLVFMVTLSGSPFAQALLIALSAMFTALMLLIVLALDSPFADGAGRISPRLIEETTQSMEGAASFPVSCP